MEEERGDHRDDERDRRAGKKHPGGGRAHTLSFRKSCQIENTQQRRPDPAGDGVRLVDDAEEQRGACQNEEKDDHRELQISRPARRRDIEEIELNAAVLHVSREREQPFRSSQERSSARPRTARERASRGMRPSEER
jgi:hypothetical protein